MRSYIRIDGYYYELSDIEINLLHEFTNVYFYKSFDHFKTFQLVFKGLERDSLEIFDEEHVPVGEKPPYYSDVKARNDSKFNKFVGWMRKRFLPRVIY